jgi:hypothetical protein
MTAPPIVPAAVGKYPPFLNILQNSQAAAPMTMLMKAAYTTPPTPNKKMKMGSSMMTTISRVRSMNA